MKLESDAINTTPAPHAIPFSRVDCGGAELVNVQQVLNSGWLTTGEWTLRFEREFAAVVGAKHALAVNSCTSALHLALDAVGVGAGDKVLVPSLTFAATAEVVRYVGATPVLLDVDSDTGCIGPEHVRAALKSHNPKAVIPVHFGGLAADVPAIREVCDPLGIHVIEDAAHAFPTRLGGRLVGTLSRLTCFSFYANKTITTGEGGMITTDDDDLVARIKLMRLHGIDRDAWNRFRSSKPAWQYDILAAGYKYNLPDLASAVGIAQLDRHAQMHARRVLLAGRYLEGLNDLTCIQLPATGRTIEDHSWHLFVIRLKTTAALSRDELITRLAELGIGTSVHYRPLHRMTYYVTLTGATPSDFPVAETWGNTAVSLPLFSSMTDEECDAVIRALHTLLGR